MSPTPSDRPPRTATLDYPRRRAIGQDARALGHFSSTVEVEILGTPDELRHLAEHVRTLRTFPLQGDHDPAPYAECLTAVETHDADAKVSITIDPDRRTLVITGDAASRDLLAR